MSVRKEEEKEEEEIYDIYLFIYLFLDAYSRYVGVGQKPGLVVMRELSC